MRASREEADQIDGQSAHSAESLIPNPERGGEGRRGASASRTDSADFGGLLSIGRPGSLRAEELEVGE